MMTRQLPQTIEQGPIRPPSEADSLLLRVTRNCPWNRCRFCSIYRGAKFSRRSVEEVSAEIDAVAAAVQAIKQRSWAMGFGGEPARAVLQSMLAGKGPEVLLTPEGCAAFWLARGGKNVFLQDANPMGVPAASLAAILRHLRSSLPQVQRVTTYARSATLARRSVEELTALREAGLDRVHVGLESGDDGVLAEVNKGATAAQAIEGGRRVKQAGLSLSEYVMPGLAGEALAIRHARETARVLSAIDPDFIRIRTFIPLVGTELRQEIEAGERAIPSDEGALRELRLLIEELSGTTARLVSDHMANLLPEVEGKLPQDRAAMLAVIDRYFALPEEERELFRVGRRLGHLACLDDLDRPDGRAGLARTREQWKATFGDLDRAIWQLTAGLRTL